MKKTIFLLATLVLALVTTSCNSSNKNQNAGNDAEDTAAVTVDEVLTNPDKYVDQTVTLEGICSHLCKHGGRKAFVQGNADNMLLRCEAFPGMDAPFSGEAIHHPIKVTGIFHEERIDEAYLQQMEQMGEEIANSANNGEGVAAQPEIGCETERAAHGQQDIATLSERVADYRARIAERDSIEGKPYLSFYFLEATGYEILPD